MSALRSYAKPRILRIVVPILLIPVVLIGLANGANSAPELAPEVADAGNLSAPPQVGVAAARAWTKAELLAAKPLDIVVDDRAGAALSSQQVLKAEAATLGAPGLIAGGTGPKVANTAELAGAEVRDAAGPISLAGYSYPAPYTGYEVFSAYTTYPYRTMGRLFFNQRGSSYSCSASSIGNYAIFTAGHCVHAGNNSSGGWSTSAVFVPAYKDGSAPYGQWTAADSWVRTIWYQRGNPNGLREDMGGFVLNRRSGYKISQRVGYLGFAWNQSYNLHWDSFGYSAESPFNGRRLRESEASYAYSLNYGNSGSATQGVGSNLNGGSSGGPWIWRFSGGSGATNYLNGVNSYTRVTGGGTRYAEMNGPHFTSGAKSLYDALVGDTP